jgi:hypothetical protein
MDDWDGDKIKLHKEEKKSQSFRANKAGIGSYSFKNHITIGWKRKQSPTIQSLLIKRENTIFKRSF